MSTTEDQTLATFEELHNLRRELHRAEKHTRDSERGLARYRAELTTAIIARAGGLKQLGPDEKTRELAIRNGCELDDRYVAMVAEADEAKFREWDLYRQWNLNQYAIYNRTLDRLAASLESMHFEPGAMESLQRVASDVAIGVVGGCASCIFRDDEGYRREPSKLLFGEDRAER